MMATLRWPIGFWPSERAKGMLQCAGRVPRTARVNRTLPVCDRLLCTLRTQRRARSVANRPAGPVLPLPRITEAACGSTGYRIGMVSVRCTVLVGVRMVGIRQRTSGDRAFSPAPSPNRHTHLLTRHCYRATCIPASCNDSPCHPEGRGPNCNRLDGSPREPERP